jgi:hypothetical protein
MVCPNIIKNSLLMMNMRFNMPKRQCLRTDKVLALETANSTQEKLGNHQSTCKISQSLTQNKKQMKFNF